jgi:hypothetical protein
MKTLLGLCLLLGMANAALAAGPDNPLYSSEEVRFTSGPRDFAVMAGYIEGLSPLKLTRAVPKLRMRPENTGHG